MNNLTQEQVRHSQFGIGSVIKQTEQVIEVQFSSEYGMKMFQYPLAFEKHLIFCNTELQNEIQGEVNLLWKQIETERKQRNEEYRKCSEEKKIDKLAAKLTMPKKRAPAKSRTKDGAAKL